MYSLVLMMALTPSADTPAGLFNRGGCSGCSGYSCSGCSGCSGASCSGCNGCHGGREKHCIFGGKGRSCHGCSGSSGIRCRVWMIVASCVRGVVRTPATATKKSLIEIALEESSAP